MNSKFETEEKKRKFWDSDVAVSFKTQVFLIFTFIKSQIILKGQKSSGNMSSDSKSRYYYVRLSKSLCRVLRHSAKEGKGR